MEFLELPSVRSTSEYAQEWLASSAQPSPVAIFAHRQTAGVGQRRRSWHSPQGGMYLSIAHPGDDLADWPAGMLPLFVAVALCEWMEIECGIRASIKWPNDIIFEGKKLAGILCQAQSRGTRVESIVIGIGLNVDRAVSGLPYDTTCLSEAARIPPQPPGQLARRFIAHWQDFTRRCSDAILQLLPTYLIQEGQPWRAAGKDHGPLKIHLTSHLTHDGHLVLHRAPRGTDQNEPLVLSSAGHDYSWLYQKGRQTTGCAPLIVADVGNSATKIAMFKSCSDSRPCLVEVSANRQPGDSELEAALADDRMIDSGWPVFIGSVCPSGCQAVQGWARKLGLVPIEIRKRPIRRRRSPGYRLDQIGIDRLAFQESWLAQHPSFRQKSAVLVSAGTITTIDVIGSDGINPGGYLIPGIQTSLDCMDSRAALLPKLAGNVPSNEELPLTTQSAMIGGTIQSTVALIRAIHDRLATEVQSTEIILTGGHASMLAPLLPEASVHPQAILDGLRLMSIS